MLCRVEMPTNEQIFGRFYRHRMLRKGGGARYSVILLPLVFILASAMLFISDASPLLIAGLAAIVVAYFVYTLYLKPNSLFKQKGGIALQTEVYIFTDNGFTRSLRSEEGGLPDNTSGQYDVLVSAVETGKDFYLFTSQTQAYLIDKEYFTKGAPEELRAMLLAKLGPKFKAKK